MKNSRTLLCAALLLALTTLLAVTLGSYAWFDSLRRLRTEETLLSSESQDVSIDTYTVVMCEDSEAYVEKACHAENHQDMAFYLKSYDTVFGRNSETPVYFLIPVTGQAVREGRSLSFTVHAEGPLRSPTETGKIAKVMSNVMRVSCLAVGREAAEAATYNDLYTLMHEEGTEPSSATFASYEVNDTTGEVTNFGAKQDASVIVSGYSAYTAGAECYVLLELDYDPTLLVGLLNNSIEDLSSHRLDQAQTFDIIHDITTITVTAEDET